MQAQSGAFLRLGGEERLEGQPFEIGGKPGAVIGHDAADLIPGLALQPDGDPPLSVPAARAA